MKIKKQVLLDLGLPYEGVIEDQLIRMSRWMAYHRVIFLFEGQHYYAEYHEGLTEYQDERAWDHEDEIECTPVKQVTVSRSEWWPIDRPAPGEVPPSHTWSDIND
jgi:hypothetical protein